MKKTFVAVVVGLLILAGIVFYIYGGKWSSTAQPNYAAEATNTPAVEVAASTLQTRTAPAGQKEYANTTYQFSVFYPDNLAVTEYKEASNGHTISFESADGTQGFQIYVIPYAHTQIAESQILLDTHGTATTTPQEIVLSNGTNALAFWSNGGVLGEMREVWFLHGGYLYEVTAYASLDSWLAGIMQTLEFTK